MHFLNAPQWRRFSTIVAVSAGLAVGATAQAATLVDTGAPAPGSVQIVLTAGQDIAGQFTLSGLHTINTIELFLETRAAGNVTVDIFADAASLPSGPALFSQTYAVGVASEHWEAFGGLNWVLANGPFWVAFVADSNYGGGAGFNAPSPLAAYAFSFDHVIWNPTTDQFGVRITGDVPQTPLPAALPLFATGLGAMGLLGWRRRRKAAALAA